MTRVIAHVSDSSVFGGTEQAILHLVAGQDRSRWQSVLLHPEPAFQLAAGARALDVEHVPSVRPAALCELSMLPRLVQQIRQLRPSVLHAHLTDPLSCRFTLLAAALAGVPAIVATAQLFQPVGNRRGRLQHRLIASVVDRYIAVSKEVASKLRDPLRVPESKIRIINNGVVLDRFQNVEPGDLRRELTDGTTRPVVLTLARLDPQKGHRYLLEAASQVPEALFVFAGDGRERGALERQAYALGLQSRLRFLGHRHDVPQLLASCDLVLLPSLHEGLPLSLLEAMAAGKPVVATSIGGTDELVVHEETGLLVPPTNPYALAAATRTIIANPALARWFGANGRTRVGSHFSVDAMVRQVEAVYDDLLG